MTHSSKLLTEFKQHYNDSGCDPDKMSYCIALMKCIGDAVEADGFDQYMADLSLKPSTLSETFLLSEGDIVKDGDYIEGHLRVLLSDMMHGKHCGEFCLRGLTYKYSRPQIVNPVMNEDKMYVKYTLTVTLYYTMR